MDPTTKNPQKPTTKITSKHHPTTQDSTFAPPPSTIKQISNQFAKLYANQKLLASLKGSNGNGVSHDFDANLQFDSSCVALTKSSSQHVRSIGDLGECTRAKVKEKDKKIVKKSHQEIVDVEKVIARQKYNEKKKAAAAQKEKDMKKANSLMSKSLDDGSDEMKKRPSIPLALSEGRRRKSFCCSQTELADFFFCTGVKVVAVDMPPFMQIQAVIAGAEMVEGRWW